MHSQVCKRWRNLCRQPSIMWRDISFVPPAPACASDIAGKYDIVRRLRWAAPRADAFENLALEFLVRILTAPRSDMQRLRSYSADITLQFNHDLRSLTCRRRLEDAASTLPSFCCRATTRSTWRSCSLGCWQCCQRRRGCDLLICWCSKCPWRPSPTWRCCRSACESPSLPKLALKGACESVSRTRSTCALDGPFACMEVCAYWSSALFPPSVLFAQLLWCSVRRLILDSPGAGVKTEHLSEVGIGSCLCCQAAQVPSCPTARAAVANLHSAQRGITITRHHFCMRDVASVCAKHQQVSRLSHVDVLQVGRLTGLTKLYMVCPWGEHMRTWPRVPRDSPGFPFGILR